MTDSTRSKQKVFYGSRTYTRAVVEITKTPFGLRGRARIKGKDCTARHWFGDQWSATWPWQPYRA